ECFTYKLGELTLKAHNTWYKGGYINLYFQVKKLKKEIQKKGN
ncbi:TPA: alpha-2,3-sialyltransferase, partial [Campylobacter coli]